MDPSSVLTSDSGERAESLVQKSPSPGYYCTSEGDGEGTTVGLGTGKQQFCALPASLLDSSCRHSRQTSISC